MRNRTTSTATLHALHHALALAATLILRWCVGIAGVRVGGGRAVEVIVSFEGTRGASAVPIADIVVTSIVSVTSISVVSVTCISGVVISVRVVVFTTIPHITTTDTTTNTNWFTIVIIT
jgi:hypothetical protein